MRAKADQIFDPQLRLNHHRLKAGGGLALRLTIAERSWPEIFFCHRAFSALERQQEFSPTEHISGGPSLEGGGADEFLHSRRHRLCRSGDL